MFEQEERIKIYAVTTRQVIQRLEDIEGVDISTLQNTIEEAFDGYDVDEEEELIGMESWPEIKPNSTYVLDIKVNHPNAYEFTIYVETTDTTAKVVNVL